MGLLSYNVSGFIYLQEMNQFYTEQLFRNYQKI